jgi:flagellin-like hook-associated protein FlgL
MERIASFAASNHVLGHVMRSQNRMMAAEEQVSSGKIAQTYAQLDGETRRLLSMENARTLTQQFVRTNEAMQGRLEMVETSLSAVDETLRDFRALLNEHGGNEPLDEQQVIEMQTWAFRALEEMEAFLNSKFDGRYLFAGSRATTEPIDLGLTNLADFRARFDGRTGLFPETREAHLPRFTLSDPAGAAWLKVEEPANGPSRLVATTAMFTGITAGTAITVSGTPGGGGDGIFRVASVGGGGTILNLVTEKVITEPPLPADPPVAATVSTVLGLSLDETVTGGLRFDGTTDTITAVTAGSLGELKVGDIFHVGGSASNDGAFEVVANDGTAVTVRTRKLVDSGGVAVTGTIQSISYYQGDEVGRTVRVDEDRSFEMDLNGVHPAFEKAIRAMALVAQGAFGTAGGLEQHRGRIDQAIGLLNSALERSPAPSPALGPEAVGSLEDVRMQVGFQQVLLDETVREHKEKTATLDIRIGEVEDADQLEAIARLLSETRSLEASYQSLARIRQLSLTQFL